MSEKIIKSIIVDTVGELRAKLQGLSEDIPVAWSYKSEFKKGISICQAGYSMEEQTFTDAFDYTEYTHIVYKKKERVNEEERNLQTLKKIISGEEICLEINKYYVDLEGYVPIFTTGDLLRFIEILDDNISIITPDSNFELQGSVTKGLRSWLYSVDDAYIYVIDMF